MKAPSTDEQEKPEAPHNCPKCGKPIFTDGGGRTKEPHISTGPVCTCADAGLNSVAGANAVAGVTSAVGSGAVAGPADGENSDIDNSKTQKVVVQFQSEESKATANMQGKLRQLRHTQSGITFKRADANRTSSETIGLMDGAIIGGIYRIIKRIGSGAMGEVYLAEHIMLGKKCALKIIPPDQVSESSWLRFQTEAKAVAMLDHTNLVKVSDLGIHEGCLPFYAMEYLEGETLEELLIEQKILSLNTALEIIIPLCDGLEYAHRHNIIHRDLKPANIMLLAGPIGKDTVKLLDFGLAKLTQQDKQAKRLTSVGEIFGSPPYMSPEQCSAGKIDSRSDIYSLGCTLFECLTGHPPFTGTLAHTLLYNHQNTVAPTLASVMGPKYFPETMDLVMARLLCKDPQQRYQTMAAVRSDLEAVSRGENVLDDIGRTADCAVDLTSSRHPWHLKQEDLQAATGPRAAVGGGIGVGAGAGAGAAASARAAVEAGAGAATAASAHDGKSADTWVIKKPPKIVWVFACILLVSLVSAYAFYALHQDSQLAVAPVLSMDAVPLSAKETSPFSSIVEENGQRLRRFNFPLDASLGQIHSASNLVVVPAMGQVHFLETDPVYFVPDNILARFPGYLKRFRPRDIYAVTIPNVANCDALIKAVSAIPQIEKLTIYRCQSVTGEGFKNVQYYDHLVDLDCIYNKVDVSGIGTISRLKELKTLRLSGEKNVYPVIKGLEHSARIKELDLDDCQITGELLAIISSLPNLTTQNCRHPQVLPGTKNGANYWHAKCRGRSKGSAPRPARRSSCAEGLLIDWARQIGRKKQLPKVRQTDRYKYSRRIAYILSISKSQLQLRHRRPSRKASPNQER
jgi:serine/threonine protein kinase